ncbi:hypothetical protein SDJN02_03785, partial [Cucurbita argyrosperma subsp. argyrosperma]
MASDVIRPAANGAPPLNPVQPSQRNPAPNTMWSMLFGGKLCLSRECRGPTCGHGHQIRNHHHYNLIPKHTEKKDHSKEKIIYPVSGSETSHPRRKMNDIAAGVINEVPFRQRCTRHTNEPEQSVTECHTMCPQHPTDEHRSEAIERHEGGVDSPFFLHHAAIEDDQPRNSLEADHGGCRELPCIVGLVVPVGN